jgi:hypothetical protein
VAKAAVPAKKATAPKPAAKKPAVKKAAAPATQTTLNPQSAWPFPTASKP